MGAQSVLGGSVAWHVEYDKDPSRILAHHWPDVPNHGDVKHTDWHAVEPVDVLTAGYPCQPFSHAGKRKGADDPRHLWPDVARAIGALRPGLVVLENVRGHVSLGLADVLADLSGLGYDAAWGVVRAADAGAPHGRARIFIVATPVATPDAGHDGRCEGVPWRPPTALARTSGGGTTPDAGSGPLARTAATGHGLPVAAERRHLAPADARRERHGSGQDGGGVGRVDGPDAGTPRERERPRGVAVDRGAAASAAASGDRWGEGWPESAGVVGRPDAAVSGGAVASDTSSHGRRGCAQCDRPSSRGVSAPLGNNSDRRVLDNWGAYGPAIARWEHVLGRPAPRPTEPGRNGPRLSPAFVEWMQGLPEGHVTDVPDLTRNAQLKALGNGVVPQQAALAIRTLLNVRSAAA